VVLEAFREVRQSVSCIPAAVHEFVDLQRSSRAP
jgi:hypothetical protein